MTGNSYEYKTFFFFKVGSVIIIVFAKYNSQLFVFVRKFISYWNFENYKTRELKIG